MQADLDKSEARLYSYIFKEKSILEGYRGSIAHNLHVPREADNVFGVDDIDTFGIYIFPLDYYISLEGYYHSKEVVDRKVEEDDVVKYELRKAFHLLSGCNPNIISFLWNRPDHYTHISNGGEILLGGKHLFLSRRRIRDAFSGYAYAQLCRLTEGAYKGYMGERRRAIVDQYGYDTKNAATLLRLLRQGIEVLETGEIITYREDDREFLIGVKTGQLSLAQVQDYAEREFKQLNEAFEKSSMPMDNDRTKINELLVKILREESHI